MQGGCIPHPMKYPPWGHRPWRCRGASLWHGGLFAAGTGHPTVWLGAQGGAAFPPSLPTNNWQGSHGTSGRCPLPADMLFLAQQRWYFPFCHLQPGLPGWLHAVPSCPLDYRSTLPSPSDLNPLPPPALQSHSNSTPQHPGGCCLLTAVLGSMRRCCRSRASCHWPSRHRWSSWHSGAPRTLARAQTPPEAPGGTRLHWHPAQHTVPSQHLPGITTPYLPAPAQLPVPTSAPRAASHVPDRAGAAAPTQGIARQQEASRSYQHLEILLPCLVDHQPHAGDLGRDLL